MLKKIDYFKLAPNGVKHMLGMEKYLKEETTITPKMFELIKIRASQINGCAYCLNMHTNDAIAMGETPQRIFLLNAWEETDLYTPAEKLVLEFVEKVTLISEYEIDKDLYFDLSEHFTDKEIVDLLFIITQINTWNRFGIVLNDLKK